MLRWTVALFVSCLFCVPACAEHAIDGVWKLKELSAGDNNLTPAGAAKMAAYNYMTDDPALQCSPASFTRIVFTPQTYLEIRTTDERVNIDYEFLDVKRSIALDPGITLETATHSVPDHPHLGRSIARFEEQDLVIETTGYQPGVVTTLTSRAGLPRSADMVTEERFRLEGDLLWIELTHIDPVYYEQPLVMQAGYERTDEALLEFGCDLEDADHYN